jgi:ABC-type cobalamin/Fe3+-siderophores transport system ATPase subunit
MVPLLAGNNWGNDVRVQGFECGPDTDCGSRYNAVGADYFSALGVSLTAGRDFTRSDQMGGTRVAIVNQTFADKFGLRYGPRRNAISASERRERVRQHIELVNLQGSAEKYPHELSGGMRQRCAIARLLANEPEVLLMDEPFAALDAQTRIILQEELLRIWGETRPQAERRTVVFITHSIDEAVFLADRLVVMSSHPGRIIRTFEIDLERPRQETVRGDQHFQALNQEIWALIRDEVYRAAMTGAG